MTASGRRQLVHFGVFQFDPVSGDLWKESRRIRLQNQPRQVLRILVSRPGELVTREELRRELWPEDTFVDFDNGLNVAVRKIRDALGDTAPSPRFIETERALGYRFITPVTGSGEPALAEAVAMPPMAAPAREDAATRVGWRRLTFIVAVAAFAIVVAVAWLRHGSLPTTMSYTQLTNFTDSALAPVLSPDGRMVAFFRSEFWWLTRDQVWIKMLPNGEPVRLTNVDQGKYGIAFSPDGTRVSFTVFGPVWRTMTVPTLGGGEPTLFMQNAAGLSWIGPNQVLFSEIKGTGLHMGLVTSRENRADRRELYFPAHERAMAHLSWLSPNRKSVLVVEMEHTNAFGPCLLVPFDGSSSVRQVGPLGNCTAAAWSPDGTWMYFTVVVDGSSHLWRQRFPQGEPQQLTNGPNEESGIAMFPDGRSLITSIGSSQSSLWMHDPEGERQLTSEGSVVKNAPDRISPPRFSADGHYLYYLLQRQSPASARELWRVDLESGKSQSVVSEPSIQDYDISRNGEEAVFSTQPIGAPSQIWLASIDGTTPPRMLGQPGDATPQFIENGEIAFRMTVDAANYLGAMKPDGSNRRKLAPYPISNVFQSSPDGRWVVVMAPYSKVVGAIPSILAIPVDGAAPREICPALCFVTWSLDATTMHVKLSQPTLAGAGITAVIRLKPGQLIPDLPEGGLRAGFTDGIPGLHVVRETDWRVPLRDENTYALIRGRAHRNLFRVTLPE